MTEHKRDGLWRRIRRLVGRDDGATFRAYYGDGAGGPDWTYFDHRNVTWHEAVRAVREVAQQFADDDQGCPVYAAEGRRETAELDALTPGDEWAGNLEGDELMVVREGKRAPRRTRKDQNR